MHISDDGSCTGLCVPESGIWCRSQIPGNLLSAPGRVCSAHPVGLENAVVWGERLCGVRLVYCVQGGRDDDLVSGALWGGRQPEIFIAKKHKVPFLCRMRWLVNSEPEAEVTWEISGLICILCRPWRICARSILCAMSLCLVWRHSGLQWGANTQFKDIPCASSYQRMPPCALRCEWNCLDTPLNILWEVQCPPQDFCAFLGVSASQALLNQSACLPIPLPPISLIFLSCSFCSVLIQLQNLAFPLASPPNWSHKAFKTVTGFIDALGRREGDLR